MLRKLLIFLVLRILRYIQNPFIYLSLARQTARKINFLYPFPNWASRSTVQMAHVSCVWVRKRNSSPKNVLMYIHGGAFILGLNAAYYLFAAKLANSINTSVLLIDYRLAPEHHFPAALEDCLTVYDELLAQGILPKNIIVMGDSAGGGLALATILALKKSQKPLPAGEIILSGWIDLSLSGASLKAKQSEDPILFSNHFIKVVECYIGKEMESIHPLISPLFADLHGLPPLFMHIGTREVLWDDTMRFAQKARSEGVKVTVKEGEGMVHIHPILFSNDIKNLSVIKEIKTFIKTVINREATDKPLKKI